MKTLFRGISKLYGLGKLPYRSGREMREVMHLDHAYLLVENGIITEIGADINAPKIDHVIDFQGAEVLPGFVDSHTHSVFAATREEEFVMRINGASYEEIAEAGGGILNSAKKLSLASEDFLFEEALERIRQMIKLGTTVLEIKSGYGLSVEAEMKMLRVIKRLKQALPIQIKSTFLGAHAFPIEFRSNKEEYIQLIVEQMLPLVAKESLADHVDVFCENGFFTAQQTSQILTAASALGFPSKIHGNQLSNSGGVEVAVKHHAWSVDHLEYTDEPQWKLLKQSFQSNNDLMGTMPVALPGVSFYLGLPYSKGRAMIDFGLPLALATDFNPGSSPVNSLQLVMAMACTQMKLSPEEAFNAITINAAFALRLQHQCGTLALGKRADFLVMKSRNSLAKIPYFLGQNQVARVFVSGEEFV